MGLPARRHSKSRKRVRRAAIKLSRLILTKCPQCQRLVRPHLVCGFCGYYRGKEVVKIKFKKGRKTKEKKK